MAMPGWRELLGASHISPEPDAGNCADMPDEHPPPAPPDPPTPATRAHFASFGCELLADDLDYLRRYLPTGTTQRNGIIRAYIATWLAAMTQEAVAHCRQNAGRFAANTWLRTSHQREDQ